MSDGASIERRIEQLQERQKQNAAKLARLNARRAQTERKADTRRKILIGAVVLKKAQNDPVLAAQLIQWLGDGLITSRDRALFPGLGLETSNDLCQKN